MSGGGVGEESEPRQRALGTAHAPQGPGTSLQGLRFFSGSNGELGRVLSKSDISAQRRCRKQVETS